MNSLTDQQLLREYAGNRSESAFAELVRRHVDLVHSAALRMVRDAHLAQDVTQGVFLALAQEARRLTDRPVLSGWLHRTAQNLAANAVRTDVRRRAREQEAAAMNQLLSADSDTVWEHISPQLDAVLGELTEPDRDALLLRYFEKKSAREMAQILGVSDEAAQKRVNRAVERLREFFAKRGVTVSAAGLVVLITANAVQAAPAGLAMAISTTAVVAGTTVAAASTVTATKVIAMTTLQKTLITAGFAVTVSFGILEARQTSGLRDKLRELSQQQGDKLQQLERERNEAADKLAGLQAENARLNQTTGELLKLRAEVGRLSKEAEAAALAKQRQVLAREKPPATDPTSNGQPFQTFSAKVRVSVPWDQAVIFGGWKLPSGQREIVVTTPKRVAEAGQLLVETKILGVSEVTATSLGLDKYNTDGRETTTSAMLGADQFTALMNALEQSNGVDLLSAPRVITRSGIQSQVSMTETKTSQSGENYLLGPVVDYIPTISNDGQSVDMQIVANVNYPTTPSVK